MYLRYSLTIVLSLILFFSSTAQVRKYSNEFLAIGVGARALGMGNANVSLVDDVTAGYWNPAGLTQIKDRFQISVMHAEYFASIAKYDYGAVAAPLKSKDKFLAFSFIRLGVDDIPNTLELIEPDGTINYDNIKSFSVADYAFITTFAQKTKIKGLSFGGSFKLIYRTAGSFATAWGFGLDAGLTYEIKKFRLGLMARDVTGTFNAWSFNFTEKEQLVLSQTNNIIPENSLEVTVPRFILGGSYNFNIKNKFYILPSIDIEMTTDGKRNVALKTNTVSFDPRFGLELNYLEIVYLRGGVNNIQKLTDESGESRTSFQPNVGVGIRIKGFDINYAYTRMTTEKNTLFTHAVSLNLRINRKKKSN
jgi:hypothetical protein